ncbi:MAG: hypothetical protein CM15mV99_160 [Caudoviricetes sp.]|nr:MAG: hypothetical protein CM15mV99_160 [Caudoviricetes sp.]
MSISSAGLVNIPGDLTVGGTTTTINTANLDVEDKNITLGKVSTPTDTTADGGGLTLKGATDKTFNWVNATDSWTSSEHISVSGQKEFRYLDSDSSHYVGFKSPATVSSNVVWTLPSADSSVSGYVLSSNASGVLSWVAPGQNADPNFTGTLTLTDDGNIRGFASTQATYTGSVKTFTVTVATKTAAHRYNGSGSSNGYVIDGKEAPFLTLTPGRTYKFDQSHSSNTGHPLRFYLEANKTTAYTTNVTVNGTAGQSGAYVQIVIGDTTPMVIHYQCSSHALMGNAVQTNSATATGTLLSSLSVSGNMDVTGTFTVSDNILMTGTGAIDVASGTTAQRPGSPSAGMFRFNSQTSEFEGYDGSAWGEIGGSAATSGTADLLDIASSSGTGGGSATFNGSAYRFKLVTKGTSTAVTPANAEILRVSINGVMQQPNDGSGQGDMTDGYVVSGTDIIFDSAPPSGSTYFIINMGTQVAVGNAGLHSLQRLLMKVLILLVFLLIYHSSYRRLGLKVRIKSITFNSSTGLLTATTFSGSGASLTNLPSSALTGALPAIDGSALTGVSSQKADGCVTENSLTISNNYTMTTNKSGISAGDIIIASGVTVTIPSGSRFCYCLGGKLCQ